MIARKWASVTASDTENIPHGTVKALYVGTAGNVAVVGQDDNAETFVSVPAGTLLEINAKRVNSTNTTASDIIALYD